MKTKSFLLVAATIAALGMGLNYSARTASKPAAPATPLTAASAAAAAQEPAPPQPPRPPAPPTQERKNYTLGVKGHNVSQGVEDGGTRRGAGFVGTTEGDLAGLLNLSLDYDRAERKVTGGNWSLNLNGEAPGTVLQGTVEGGSVTLDADGKIVSASVTLKVMGGSKRFAAVRGGVGTFAADVDQSKEPAEIKPQGSLTFNF